MWGAHVQSSLGLLQGWWQQRNWRRSVRGQAGGNLKVFTCNSSCYHYTDQFAKHFVKIQKLFSPASAMFCFSWFAIFSPKSFPPFNSIWCRISSSDDLRASISLTPPEFRFSIVWNSRIKSFIVVVVIARAVSDSWSLLSKLMRLVWLPFISASSAACATYYRAALDAFFTSLYCFAQPSMINDCFVKGRTSLITRKISHVLFIVCLWILAEFSFGIFRHLVDNFVQRFTE